MKPPATLPKLRKLAPTALERLAKGIMRPRKLERNSGKAYRNVPTPKDVQNDWEAFGD